MPCNVRFFKLLPNGPSVTANGSAEANSSIFASTIRVEATSLCCLCYSAAWLTQLFLDRVNLSERGLQMLLDRLDQFIRFGLRLFSVAGGAALPGDVQIV